MMRDNPRPPLTLLAAILLLVAGFAMLPTSKAAESAPVRPFESDAAFRPANQIDRLVMEEWKQRGIRPARPCSDAFFVRRVYLDLIGTLPTAREARAFLDDPDPDKRSRLIDALMEREEFADYWTLKWCDLLRVKSEFPINMWPNGVQAYRRWIYEAMRDNMPYDRFVRELLTSSGSNFRVPQVNFYRGVQGEEPSAIAAAVGITFMGVRVEKWDQGRREGMESFFSRVAYKGTAEWKEVIVYPDPAAYGPLQAVLPDGERVSTRAGRDPRQTFARWLIRPENPWFARNIVNRAWSWFFGRGIIHEPDDIRPDNAPVHPRVLSHLERELVEADYNLRHVFRLILNSSTYQQSPIPRSDDPVAERLFACYPVRRLDAEVLIDAICDITGTHESYSSVVPEPYTFVPEQDRSIQLADGSITSSFLKMFGRPSCDTGLESERSNRISDAQRLHLLNSTHIQEKIERGPGLRALVGGMGRNPEKLLDVLYLTILSRYPTPPERRAAAEYHQAKAVNRRDAVHDLTWGLMNTKEFLYRH
jgi:hypothetical protein